jgi:O-antigen ligase
LLAFAFVCNFSISLSQISLGLALIAAIFLWRSGQLRVWKTPVISAFAFFAFAGGLSLFGAEDKLKALVEMKKFLLLGVFFLFWYPEIKPCLQKRLLSLFVFTATLVAVSSLYDYFMGLTIEDRARGFFSTSITFGECQVMALLLLLTWFLSGSESTKETGLLVLSFSIIMGSVLVNMTRGAWLGFLAGSILLFVRFPRKMLPLALILGLFVFPAIYFSPAIKQRVASFSLKQNLENLNNNINSEFNSGEMRSNFERLNIWTRGFKIVESRFIFGLGMNNVKSAYRKLATDYEKKNPHLIYGHQHSNFMQFFTMTGLLGLTAFFIFLMRMFRFLLNRSKTNSLAWNQKISSGAPAIFLCFVITGLTEYSWSDEEVAMMAFFLVGLLMNHRAAGRIEENQDKPQYTKQCFDKVQG